MTATTKTPFSTTCDGSAALARLRRRRWWTVLAGMAAANACWAVCVPGMGIDVTVRQGETSTTIGALSVTLSSLGAGLPAWLLLELLERWVRRPRAWWRSIACLVFVLSLSGPLSATNGAAAAVLLALHVLVGGTLLIGLGWRAGRVEAWQAKTQ